ncbi:hypothetical protein HJC23_003460 [Cyclotella cryptica]|uniref:Peptidase S54 rhomboid domain-containing protein n=1 Tax=Cyclotella cryptica TaxID=29204 RepID=A0ABD3QS19_9STRA|eukprot:CCRYP_002611-RB/>CCRYP_002611-RB protein AED:0.32 eAED:0.32 QI:162/1/1/1/0.5/0.33/3/1454/333
MTRRSSSSEHALGALHLLIILNILVHLFRNDLKSQLSLTNTYRIFDGNIQSMLLSMFYHLEPTHLMMNMLALYRFGNELFVNSSSRKWRSFAVVFLSYIACGMFAFKGLEMLSKYHEYQWRRKLNDARYASRCTHWLCDSINQVWGIDVTSYFTDAWSDLTTLFPFADIVSSIYHFQLIRRIGASGVIYGWMGMRLFTSCFSKYHSRLSSWDYFFFVGTLAHDLSNSPLTLEDLRMSDFLDGDGIDHAAHFFGAVGGILVGFSIFLWDMMSSFQWGGWRGRGNRLGERWEYERQHLDQDQQIADQQRRERSRLLNHGRSLNSNRSRTRERTML